MKPIALAATLAASALLSGCVVYPYGHRHHSHFQEAGPVYEAAPVYRGDGHRRDWDGDGVPNRRDRRPHDPYRY